MKKIKYYWRIIKWVYNTEQNRTAVRSGAD